MKHMELNSQAEFLFQTMLSTTDLKNEQASHFNICGFVARA